MNKTLLLTLVLAFCSTLAFQPAVATVGAPHSNNLLENATISKPLNKKEIRKQERLREKSERLQNLITKKVQKHEQKTGKKIFDSLDHYLRLTLIFFLAAVVFSILSAFVSPIAYLAGAAALVSVVFFILWLSENV